MPLRFELFNLIFLLLFSLLTFISITFSSLSSLSSSLPFLVLYLVSLFSYPCLSSLTFCPLFSILSYVFTFISFTFHFPSLLYYNLLTLFFLFCLSSLLLYLSSLTVYPLSHLFYLSSFPFCLSSLLFFFCLQGYGFDAGLRVGDRLVTVGGVDASQMNVEQVKSSSLCIEPIRFLCLP